MMERLKKILVNVCRMVLALTFIFSGFVKAVDPQGTQYKLNDYLGALGINSVVPQWMTLTAAVLLGALEFSVGIFLLFAIHRRTTSKVAVAIMAVMTPLTLWLAVANPISDCGCFGDALVLTNWQTLWKNVVLLGCAVVVCCWPLLMPRLISRTNQWIVVNFTFIFILLSSLWCLYDLPIFDFRPYHIGANIKEGMEIPEGAAQPKFETTFILEKDGERREFTLEDYPDSTWTFIDSRSVQTEAGYVPPIHDFSIISMNDGQDMTDDVLSREGYTFLLIAPHLEQASDSNFGAIDQLYEYCEQHGYPFYCLTASGEKAISHWRDITGAEYPFCQTDETTLKTIIRSNPGLLLLKQGTIIRKWSHNNLPQMEPAEANMPLEALPIGRQPADSTAGKILKIILWFVLPLFVLTLADRLLAWTRWMRRKPRKENENENNDSLIHKKKEENEKENCSR